MTKEQRTKLAELLLADEIETNWNRDNQYKGSNYYELIWCCSKVNGRIGDVLDAFRIKPAPVPKSYSELQDENVKKRGLKEGDKVKIVCGFEDGEDGIGVPFTKGMEACIGKQGTIKNIYDGSHSLCRCSISIEVDKNYCIWQWHFKCLEKVEKVKRIYTSEDDLVGKRCKDEMGVRLITDQNAVGVWIKNIFYDYDSLNDHMEMIEEAK